MAVYIYTYTIRACSKLVITSVLETARELQLFILFPLYFWQALWFNVVHSEFIQMAREETNAVKTTFVLACS